MGNSLFKCASCPLATNTSVFTFSEDLVLKYTEGKSPRPLTKEELKRREDNSGDEEWMEKLRCIDDSHTEAYGLTEGNINRLWHRLEAAFAENEIKCHISPVEGCFKHHENCTIKCSDKAKDYIECVNEELKKKITELYEENKEGGL